MLASTTTNRPQLAIETASLRRDVMCHLTAIGSKYENKNNKTARR